MSTKAKAPEEAIAPVTIGALAIAHRVRPPVLAGVCAANGWQSGKTVTEEEFLSAVRRFEQAPMGGERKVDA